MFSCSRLHDVGQHDDLWVTQDSAAAQAADQQKRVHAVPGSGQPGQAAVATDASRAAGRASEGVADIPAQNAGTSQFAGTGAGTVLSSSVDTGGNKRYHTSPGPSKAAALSPPGQLGDKQSPAAHGAAGALSAPVTVQAQLDPDPSTCGPQQRQARHRPASPHGQHRRLHAKLLELTHQAQHGGMEAGGQGTMPSTAWLVAKGMQQAGTAATHPAGSMADHLLQACRMCTRLLCAPL